MTYSLNKAYGRLFSGVFMAKAEDNTEGHCELVWCMISNSCECSILTPIH